MSPSTTHVASMSEATRAVHSRASLLDLPPVISKQQAEADRRYFMERHGNSSTKAEIEAERIKLKERRDKHNPKREATRIRNARLREEERELTRRYEPLRFARKGKFNLPPGTYAAVRELAAERDENGEQKWSWRAIGRILGISSPCAREIADQKYGQRRGAYKAAA